MELKNKKILITCPISAGIDGVWTRVKQDAKMYKEMGNEVLVISSNRTKGSNEIAPSLSEEDGVIIKRFDFKKLGGETFMKWDKSWKDLAYDFCPDLIITHVYRHIHTTESLKIARELHIPIFLVTHAPFVEGDVSRSFLSKWIVRIYDKTYGRQTIKKFDKIIAVANWEKEYLKRLGVDMNKVEVIKNYIPKEFKEIPIGSYGPRDVLFLGRISPIKDIETIIRVAERMPNIKFTIVGSSEPEYAKKLHDWIIDGQIHNIDFYPPVYDVEEKIKLIDEHKFFILPSIREAMPTVLLEAKERKRIIVASDNPGNREVIEDYSNGYLFPVGDYETVMKHLKILMKNGKNN